MEDKLSVIKSWLGSGSINFFGLPMSGKDTQGLQLAKALDAVFLSSGEIIRQMEQERGQDLTSSGNLIPTNIFYEWVLPYFERRELFGKPIVLSSIGRWSGEENQVMSVAKGSDHEIKAVIALIISESDAKARFSASKALGDRGNRTDDQSLDVLDHRLQEFREKTVPVLKHYQSLDLLIKIDDTGSRDTVFSEIVEKLYAKALKAQA